MTFASRDFSPRRGVSDEHIPQWICKEQATKSGRKRPAALRVAPNLASGFVAHWSFILLQTCMMNEGPIQPAPPSPPAWQPLTPRGVASFAGASLARLLLVELIIASLIASAVAWFLAENWFPTVRHAIHQLPDQGTIRNQRLDSPRA